MAPASAVIAASPACHRAGPPSSLRSWTDGRCCCIVAVKRCDISARLPAVALEACTGARPRLYLNKNTSIAVLVAAGEGWRRRWPRDTTRRCAGVGRNGGEGRASEWRALRRSAPAMILAEIIASRAIIVTRFETKIMALQAILATRPV